MQAFGPKGSCSSSTAAAIPTGSQTREDFSSQEEQRLLTCEDLADPAALLREALDEKMAGLVHLLVHKYQVKEQLLVGIVVKEVEPSEHSHVLITILGPTYNGMLSDKQTRPNTSLLVIALVMVFLEGNRATGEQVWEVLRVMGAYAGREHFIFGAPRRLTTGGWVWEKFLVCRPVAVTGPTRHEFLRGPKVHVETSKIKVLEYVNKIHGSDPRTFPSQYKEALRDEQDRARARTPWKCLSECWDVIWTTDSASLALSRGLRFT
ncbi:melanoma-associated antigen B16-like [Tupaia chinensis]|uniref:melanoma-associated antigen B16-like n=1 Tax=Tupaia chinensis TaxID=246437 RepID=UPI0007041165|nr:melanoma-associated antigen B16-like [Tupaia chinensis]